MNWTVAVIELCLLFAYVIAYINIWPIWQQKTKSRYKMLIFLSTAMIIAMAILGAPQEAMKVFFIVLIKDIIVFIWGCDE